MDHSLPRSRLKVFSSNLSAVRLIKVKQVAEHAINQLKLGEGSELDLLCNQCVLDPEASIVSIKNFCQSNPSDDLVLKYRLKEKK